MTRIAALALLIGSGFLALGPNDVAAARAGRGVNILGYDPIWTDPAKAHLRPGDFARIRAGGFDQVRVNLLAFAHMDAANRLDPRWLATLDRVVRDATAAGLGVILDEHDYRPCGQDLEACRPRLDAFWEQIAPRFATAAPSVWFEILNEPNGRLTPETWNGLIIRMLGVIRRSNPTRTVVVGPGNSNGFRSLPGLSLPPGDPNIVVTVHYYDPFRFTHQGADWTTPSRAGDTGITWGSAAEHAQVERDFDGIAAWARRQGRRILLGEFGAYDAADMASRAAWTAAVARSAEAHGFLWDYWQFEGTFAVFDPGRGGWIAPIHHALVP